MSTLTPEGRRLLQELVRRHGFGREAVSHLLHAMIAGRGRMAQFAHPELGGAGQWMSGGMLMLGDMFDHELKARVGALCADLSDALASGEPLTLPDPAAPASSATTSGATPGTWWPPSLGAPSASGSQGSMRYAYFADARRLAIETQGRVRVHDTLDHLIGGFSQQRGGASGLSVSSQHGAVDIAALPVVSDDGRVEPAVASTSDDGPAAGGREGAAPERAAGGVPAGEAVDAPADGSGATLARDDRVGAAAWVPAEASAGDPIELIERLGRLRDAGLVTDEEFAAKKRELLARL